MPKRTVGGPVYVLTGYDSIDGAPCVLGVFNSERRVRRAYEKYGPGTRTKPIRWVTKFLNDDGIEA